MVLPSFAFSIIKYLTRFYVDHQFTCALICIYFLIFFPLVNLYELKTYHEVIDEIYYKVAHLEPWEKGSRKTAGQTGMCGGVCIFLLSIINNIFVNFTRSLSIFDETSIVIKISQMICVNFTLQTELCIEVKFVLICLQEIIKSFYSSQMHTCYENVQMCIKIFLRC